MVTIVLSKSCKSFSFDEIWNSTQIEGPQFNGDKIFVILDTCQYWPVDIGTCHLSGHSFGNLSILAIVNIGTCYLLGHSFWTKIANAPVLMKFCTLNKTKVVNLMVLILRDASECRRELKTGIEKQILCQKYYCYIINKTGKKLWLNYVKLFS